MKVKDKTLILEIFTLLSESRPAPFSELEPHKKQSRVHQAKARCIGLLDPRFLLPDYLAYDDESIIDELKKTLHTGAARSS